jgi:hypothetical protein
VHYYYYYIIIIVVVVVNGSAAHCWALADSQFLDPIHSPQVTLDKGSVGHEASTFTQDCTNTEYRHTIIHVSSGSQSHDASVPVGEDT